MNEGRVHPPVSIRHEQGKPVGNRAYMPDMSSVVGQIKAIHGTHPNITEVNTPASEDQKTPEGVSTGKRPSLKRRAGKAAVWLAVIGGGITAMNIAFSGNEEPKKPTATDPFGVTTSNRPGTATVPPATGAATPAQSSKRPSTGLMCNMPSIAVSIDKTGNIATTAKGEAKGVEATLNIQNAKNPQEIALRAGVVVNNAIDKTNVVSIARNENGTYHIEEPIPDTVIAVYAQEGSESEICGAFKVSGITLQNVSEFTVPPTWS